ncbi:ABC transporter substrate-binding protein [Leifsonia poae]|uniref:ABC transporter substrate-binding protein n=1 Tax=Leifsonia poae TaxID=110933 RepID=UPI003D67FD6F
MSNKRSSRPRSARQRRIRSFTIGTALAAATAVLIGTSGCATGASDSADGTTLTYWASNQGTSLDNDKAVLTPVLKDFTDKTGIKVKLEVIGWNDLQTRLQTAVTSGQAPDVTNIGNTWAASLQATGAFLPFGETELKAVGGAKKFVPTALETGGAAGQDPTSVPLYGLAYGLYYNKALFAAAGEKPPTTWEELVATAKKLTTADIAGISLAGGSYTENAHFAFINSAQNGAALFDKKGKPTFTSDGVVDGVMRYLDLMQKDKVMPTADAQFASSNDALARFAAGKAAMTVTQNSAGTSLEAGGMHSDAYGVVPFPSPQGGKAIASMVAGINLSVFKNTKHKDEALKLVDYLTSESAQAALGRQFSTLPVLKGVAPSVKGDPEQIALFQKIYSTMSAPLPTVAAEDQYESTVGKAMNQLFASIATGTPVSRADVKKALQTAQDDVAASVG